MQTVSTQMKGLVTLGWCDIQKTTGNVGVAASMAPSALTADSVAYSGKVATFTTAAAHRLATGQEVTIAGATPAELNGVYLITVTGATTFTYTCDVAPAGSVSGTITATWTAQAQQAVILVPTTSTSAVSIGPNSQADSQIIQPGGGFTIEAPHGAKFELGDWYAKATSVAAATYVVLYV